MLDSTALRYFSAVARLGTIQAASEALNVASSAISRQIAALEAAIGTELCERHARGMRLTAAGEILANHARRLELENERVVADVRRLEGEEIAVIRIATVEGMGQYVVPEAVVRLLARQPGVKVRMNLVGNRQIPQQVRAGDVDIGITFALTPEPEIHVIDRFDGTIYAFARPDHPLAGRGPLAIADLAKASIFLMGQDTTVRQLFAMACAHEGVAVAASVETNSTAATCHMILAGAGLGIASFLTMGNLVRRGQLVALPIAHPILDQRSIQVQALAGRRLPAVVETFLTCLNSVIAEIGPGPGRAHTRVVRAA